MFRRIAIILSLSVVSLHGIAGANLTDGFSFLQKDPLFIEFMSAVRRDGCVEKGEEIRLLLYAQKESEPQATIKRIRIDTTLARLYIETENKDTQRSEDLLSEAEQRLESLDGNSFHALILSSEIDGVRYLNNPRNLGKGMSSSRKINKAFKVFPNELSSRLLKANSMLYAPSFAGGDVKGALNMFLAIQREAEGSLSPWDRSSLYSGIGLACLKLKDYQNAKGYLLAAKAIYPFDAVLDSYIAQVEKVS